jgi:hypothetical protein
MPIKFCCLIFSITSSLRSLLSAMVCTGILPGGNSSIIDESKSAYQYTSLFTTKSAKSICCTHSWKNEQRWKKYHYATIFVWWG